MRPPGYVRRLPFDSLDHLLAAAGVDPEAWHGLCAVDGIHDEVSERFRTDRLEDRVPQLAEPSI